MSAVKLPRIIYGTSFKKEKTCDYVVKAVRKGYRALDSSCQPMHYYEPGVGQALQVLQNEHGIPRSELFLQTRFSPFQDYQTCPYDVNCSLALQAHRSFQVSLGNLQTDHVDSFLLHSPIAPFDDFMHVWIAMESIVQDEGKVKQLGICNIHNLSLLKRLHAKAKIKPTIVQNRIYANTKFDRELREWCKQESIEYQAFWIIRANGKLLASEEIGSIANELKVTPAQVLYRYWLEEGVSPLTGTTSESHMEHDLAIFSFQLTPEHRTKIKNKVQV